MARAEMQQGGRRFDFFPGTLYLPAASPPLSTRLSSKSVFEKL